MISRDEAARILAPYTADFRDCLWPAWQDWLELEREAPRHFHAMGPRSRASIVYDLAARNAQTLLPERDGLTVTNSRGFVLVDVEDLLLVRFKKYRHGFRTCGISTTQRQLWQYQEPFPELPQRTNVVAGYLLNQLDQRTIEDMAFTCPDGRSNAWRITIPKPDVAVVSELRTPAKPPEGPTVRSTIKQDKRNEEDES